MERLTDRSESGFVCVPKGMMPEALERLAAYEDTGLEPEEIVDSIGWMSPVCIGCDGKTKEGCRTDKCGYLTGDIRKCAEQSKHLAELACAEQEGRLVVLPCKVGDTVWEIKHSYVDWPDVSKKFAHKKVFDIQDLEKFGRTVFLTREEAEKILEESK